MSLGVQVAGRADIQYRYRYSTSTRVPVPMLKQVLVVHMYPVPSTINRTCSNLETCFFHHANFGEGHMVWYRVPHTTCMNARFIKSFSCFIFLFMFHFPAFRVACQAIHIHEPSTVNTSGTYSKVHPQERESPCRRLSIKKLNCLGR